MLFLALVFLMVMHGVALNCSFQSGKFYDFALAQTCMFAFPFNQTVAAHTAKNLAKAMQLYAFKDIAKVWKKKRGEKKRFCSFSQARQKPPAPFSPPVDLDQTLSSLQEKSFGSDFEFQQALRSVFLQLHDAHTNFYAPVPMQFTFLLPFNVISYADSSNGTMVLEVASILNHAEEWNFNVSSLIGARILTIDSVPALQYVTNFAQTSVGLAKDPQVRCSREE